ncbi:hypothetical protein SKAU_G00023010 [Synaphobranchus kaupii]|uniref:Uncharacterized protein n=1 Tax=Synaphobranchus kaupii TaxID=118154 RepID=A0A9Q1JDB4_SYNKA|nr:hypothetical protein SKAU_G00023010 [Synaphobranchus kaupii]
MSQGLPGVGLRDSGLPSDPAVNRQNAPFPAQLEQSTVGAGGGVRGTQAMCPEPLVSMRLNGPSLAQNDGLSLSQSGFNTRPGLRQNNPSPYNSALATPCTHTQVTQVRQGLTSSQTTPSLGPCPQKQLRPAPPSALGSVHPDSLVLSLQNQQQLGPAAKHRNRHVFIGQSNHTAVEDQEGQWTPSIPNTNFEDNLQDVCTPNFPSHPTLLNPSSAPPLQGRFSVQTQHLHPWRQRQEVSTATLDRQQHALTHPPNAYRQDRHRDPQSGPSPHISQNSMTAYSYGTQNATPALSSSVSMTAYSYGTQNAALAPTSSISMNSCMFDGGSAHTGSGTRLSGVELGASVPQKLNPSNSQSSPQASCCFQRLPGKLVLDSSASAQGNGLPCPVTPDFTPGDAVVQHPFLNVQTQIPLQDNESFSFRPLSNGTTYFPENNQTNCCDF